MADIVTWIGIGCILGGMLLIFLEIMNPGLYIAVVGTVLIVLGALLIFTGRWVTTPPGAFVLFLVAVVASWGTIMGYRKWAKPGDKPLTVTNETLPGREGVVHVDIPEGGVGKVRVAGYTYRAVAEGGATQGEKIRVASVDGLTLTVEKI